MGKRQVAFAEKSSVVFNMENSSIELGEARLRDGLRVYAVGDVHGCIDELKQMLDLIEGDLVQHPIKDYRIVFLGDYLDRGPDSKAVVQTLMSLQEQRPEHVICLLGNHDEKLLLALEPQPTAWLDKYMKYGGIETLTSFGMSKRFLKDVKAGKIDAKTFAKAVRDEMPKIELDYLRSLPRSITIDDYFFVHAGINPERDFDQQDDHDLVWIREPFLSWKDAFSKVVIHGHTRQTQVDVRTNRINVDTSCVYGHALTTVVLEENKHRFISVSAPEYWQSSVS